MKKMSVIIPAYNRAQVLPRTLTSVLRQGYRPLEVVAVDNGSTDGTWQVLERYAGELDSEGIEVKLLRETKKGACPARNAGFHASTGERVMFFDSDDTMVANHVERIMNAFDGVDMVNWSRCLIDTAGRGEVKPLRTSDIIANHILHSTFSTQSWAATRGFYEKSGGWDESLPAWNDYELGLRLLLNEPRICHLQGMAPVTVYSSGEQSITGLGFAGRKGYWESVLDKMAGEVAVSGRDDKERLQRLIAFRRLTLAAQYAREGEKSAGAELLTRSLGELPYGALMKLLYVYISRGGRGAARLARRIL